MNKRKNQLKMQLRKQLDNQSKNQPQPRPEPQLKLMTMIMLKLKAKLQLQLKLKLRLLRSEILLVSACPSWYAGRIAIAALFFSSLHPSASIRAAAAEPETKPKAEEVTEVQYPKTSMTHKFDAAELNAPEVEFAHGSKELIDISTQLNATTGLNGPNNSAVVDAVATAAFTRGISQYAARNYLAAIRDFGIYLESCQKTDREKFLIARAKLGQSYEALGQYRSAIRSYLAFVSGFTASKDEDFEQFLFVVRRLADLGSRSEVRKAENADKLLSSLASVALPNDVKAEVLLVVGRVAVRSGAKAAARHWLDTATTISTAPLIVAKAKFLSALMLIQERDFAKAESLLQAILESPGVKTGTRGSELRDQVHLALARLAHTQNKQNTALTHYDEVAADGPYLRDAIAESIPVLFALSKDSQAFAKIQLFQANYPSDPRAKTLSDAAAVARIRSQDFSGAKTIVDSAYNRALNAKTLLEQKYAMLTHARFEDADALGRSLDSYVASPSSETTINRLREVHRRLQQSMARLTRARADLQDLTFTMGRIPLQSLDPNWVARLDQLNKLQERILAVGHRLAATEFFLYKDKYSELDLQTLTASMNRRTALESSQSRVSRQLTKMEHVARFAKLNLNLASDNTKVWKQQATIAAAAYLNAQGRSSSGAETGAASQGSRPTEGKSLDLRFVAARNQKLTNQTMRALDLVRRLRVQKIVEESELPAQRRHFISYAEGLFQESTVHEHFREELENTSRRLLADDATATWNSWRQTARLSFDRLLGLEKQAKIATSAHLNDIDNIDARIATLSDRAQKAFARLDQATATLYPSLVDQFAREVDEKLASAKKWQGDVTWLSYLEAQKERDEVNARLKLEKQILEDEVMDIKQGVYSPWPD